MRGGLVTPLCGPCDYPGGAGLVRRSLGRLEGVRELAFRFRFPRLLLFSTESVKGRLSVLILQRDLLLRRTEYFCSFSSHFLIMG